MLNQTQRLYKSKSKSKIFITILCIFGLLFSWSCSCKNRVTGPGNDGLENGKPGGQTDNKDDSGQTTIIKDGDLTADSTKVIRVSGDTVKIAAMIKFKNATATLKSFADTDSTTLTDGDITYDTATSTLTLKADTTDTSKIDTTVGGKITWEKASKKITATFTLTPAQNVTLSETEKTVVIEIYKEKLLDVQKVIGETLVQDIATISIANGTFEFYYNNVKTTQTSSTVRANPPTGSDSFDVSKEKFKTDTITKMEIENNKKSEDKKIPYSKVEFVSDIDAGNGTHSFHLKFYFSDKDYDLSDDQKNGIEYRIDVEGGQIDDGQGGKKDKLTWI